MSKVDEFTYNLQQLCSFCYKNNKFNVFIDDKCEVCHSRNINPVYVNPKKHSEFVRDFRNTGKDDHGSNVVRCQHDLIDDIYNHAVTKGCHFATNDFEYFIWNSMKTLKKFKIADLFNEFIAPFIYKYKPTPSLKHIPIVNEPKEFQNMMCQVPRSRYENEINVADNNRKLYFCWFCLKTITSEGDISTHVTGKDHKLYYEADKKRRWYFKMPRSNPVVMCTENNCDCLNPHTDDEYQEMIARIKFRNFDFSLHFPKKVINPWPTDMKFKMPMFPNNLKCYKKSIRITAEVFLSKYVLSYICLRDDESRPFFTLYDNNQKKVQSLIFESNSLKQLENFNFDIEFFPLCSGTYIQRVEFGLKFQDEEYCCQRLIRVDVGTPQHLEEFKNTWNKFNGILKRDLKFDTIIPFSLANISNNSIMTEDLLRRVFTIVSNLKWIDSRVESWNYCDWMRDMLVHEELQQQLLLSQLLFIGDMKIQSSFTKESFIPPKHGQLFGTISFKNECHDAFAREFVVNSINRVFVLSKGLNGISSLYECDLVDKYYYDVESRSINEVTLCIPELVVKHLQLKHGITVNNITIIFRFNRLFFERRHISLDRMPHYDNLFYIPLCCPSFTRLPYGDDQSMVSFRPKLKLNAEQERLPRLVLRHIKNHEIVLPFILNGAFGTGKTSVIAETVMNILANVPDTRVLICTRSYSAGKVYLKIFEECLNNKYLDTIKFIASPKKPIDYNWKKYWIENDGFKAIDFLFNKVFITTLDNVVNAMSPLLRHNINAVFGYIFVDEAAQVLEVDAISVYQFGDKSSKFVFAGDVFQVRPNYYNMSLKKFSVPIVCRLHFMYKRCPDYEICLKQVYRSHPILVDYLSKAIYMQCGLVSLVQPKYPSLKSMQFNDSNPNGDKCEEFDEYFCSYKNEHEADIIIESFQQFLENIQFKDSKSPEILICSPFFAQIMLIRNLIKNKRMNKTEKYKVTVELPTNIQGKEFDAVFISTVLTVNNEHKHPIFHATFHSNKTLINLAISRAKHYVEVVGDKKCLLSKQCHDQWEIFFEFCV